MGTGVSLLPALNEMILRLIFKPVCCGGRVHLPEPYLQLSRGWAGDVRLIESELALHKVCVKGRGDSTFSEKYIGIGQISLYD